VNFCDTAESFLESKSNDKGKGKGKVKIKVKQSHYRPGEAQRVAGD
jgi:hypothetical protein